eukprot:490309-Lingulodinium_polyedra.AAC.1
MASNCTAPAAAGPGGASSCGVVPANPIIGPPVHMAERTAPHAAQIIIHRHIFTIRGPKNL